MKQLIIIIALALLAGVPAEAAPQSVSPDIHLDRTVTFQLAATNATNVMLALETFASQPMIKEDRGAWRLTVGPLEPNIYAYSFWIDGIRVPDLGSPAVKPEPMPVSSMFEVPADAPQFFDFDPAIAHGTVRLHNYESKSLGKLRRMRVYTPPGYDQNPGASYPVLFLLHGGFDTEATWTEYGRADFIMDNLLAAKKVRPMIVVMLNGFAARNPVQTNKVDDTGNRTAFEDDLLNDALPFVEKNYRIKPGPENGAITGLSMGGGQSLTIGLTHLDRFGWVGGMSASMAKPDEALAEIFKNSEEANQRLKLLWFSCGKSDGLFQPNQRFDEKLTSHGVRHTFVPMEGGHQWVVWRRALDEFLPLIFADQK